jgi:hypothetical protein
MTVVAGAGSVTWVGDRTRDLVATTLEAHLAAVTDSLSYRMAAVERDRLGRYLDEIMGLQRQLAGAPGSLTLTGPTTLVSEVVRDTATQATHDLDNLVEGIGTTPFPLSEQAIDELRMRMTVAMACVEALVECEGSRRRSPS